MPQTLTSILHRRPLDPDDAIAKVEGSTMAWQAAGLVVSQSIGLDALPLQTPSLGAVPGQLTGHGAVGPFSFRLPRLPHCPLG